jgi:hypothetical protein
MTLAFKGLGGGAKPGFRGAAKQHFLAFHVFKNKGYEIGAIEVLSRIDAKGPAGEFNTRPVP